MKILFIYPKFVKYLEDHQDVLTHFLGNRSQETENIGKFNAPPALAMPYLTALTPGTHTWEFVNDNVEEINFETDAHVIAISFFTPQAARAYEICREFKKRNKLIVVGGMHPSICPEEAAQYADIVCVGEGEECWLEILKDIESHSYRKIYRARRDVSLPSLPIPHRHIHYCKKHFYDWQADVVQVARGCDYPCQQCIIPAVFGKTVRFQDISKVIDDVRSLQFDIFYLADDQIFQPNAAAEEYALTLFQKLKEIQHQKQIFINTAPSLNHNPKLLKHMAEAGVNTYYSTIGFDPISKNALLKRRKNLRRKMCDDIKCVRDAGMLFFASFPLGLDEHHEDIKNILFDFCLDAKIDLAEFFIFTPLPQTPLWKQLEREDRILHHRWNQYNGANVTFKPMNMAPEKLMGIYLEAWQEFPKIGSLVTSQRQN